MNSDKKFDYFQSNSLYIYLPQNTFHNSDDFSISTREITCNKR